MYELAISIIIIKKLITNMACVHSLIKSQIFSCPTRPDPVNKYFMILPLLRLIFTGYHIFFLRYGGVIIESLSMTFTANGKRQTAKIELLVSDFSRLYNLWKLFAFTVIKGFFSYFPTGFI